ncbi:transmembrane amino acid transporter [Nitzschia inconspicua]|uniref:Transmembrane amino acid transporter n=1 Tax=Nitzschia inconspicua TaxID=303405 RepID=A0A9K3LHV9_9STRA|nr:transmembrane amino acid transporter [Nitzschia inconspicua]
MKAALSYSTLNSQDDTVSDSGSSTNNNNTNSSPDMSAAASPYWSVPFQNPTTAGFSPFVAFCFTINYILGTGFLTIPWAFVQSGLVLSTILMILSALASDIAKDFLLETLARAEAMLDDQMHWIEHPQHKRRPSQLQEQKHKGRLMLPPTSKEERERQLRAIRQKQQLQLDEVSDVEEIATYQRQSYDSIQDAGTNRYSRSSSTPLDHGNNPAATPYDHHVHFDKQSSGEQQPILVYPKQSPSTKYLIEQRKFEVNALCRVFLGKFGLQLYTMVICLYLCGALWAYTSVFSSAMATALPLFGEDAYFSYTCYAILFGCVVVPLSCLELDEQVPLQVFLTLCRFLMFFLMIGTSYLAADDEKDVIDVDSFEPARNFQWSGIARTLPILVFANIFHHSIPGLAHPVGDKRTVGKVFTATNIFTVAAYITLGLTLGTAFGKGIEQSSNLNWSTFHAGTGYVDEHGNVVGAAWWTRVIAHYIILFPAVDVVSAYPLNAITLGNNIFGAAYGKRIHEVESNRFLRTCFRLLASVPPIIFGILVRELGTITDYTGTSGFLIGLCFPAILYMTSRTLAEERKFSLETFYTNYGSSVAVAKFIFWFGIFMMIFVFTKLTFFS